MSLRKATTSKMQNVKSFIEWQSRARAYKGMKAIGGWDV